MAITPLFDLRTRSSPLKVEAPPIAYPPLNEDVENQYKPCSHMTTGNFRLFSESRPGVTTLKLRGDQYDKEASDLEEAGNLRYRQSSDEDGAARFVLGGGAACVVNAWVTNGLNGLLPKTPLKHIGGSVSALWMVVTVAGS
jgi:hypothetical protein